MQRRPTDAPRVVSDALLLRGREVAEALGISRALAYRWMAGGVLPVVRRGRALRVPTQALLHWIDQNTQQPRA